MEWLAGVDFLKHWRYCFIYSNDNELIERTYQYASGSEWNSRPASKYLYHSEIIENVRTILYPNIYQFDVLNFNWFHPGKQLIEDEYWYTDCSGTINFLESATYHYTPVNLNVDVSNYERDEILVYPNPTTGELRIIPIQFIEGVDGEAGRGSELEITSIEVFDVLGRKHLTVLRSYGLTVSKLDISHLQSGIYFVKITTEKGAITKKIIKH
jgi:hypothetical protein